jgi:putative nucleotidyltransferase with HDIG domain
MPALPEAVWPTDSLTALLRALESVDGGVFDHCHRVATNAAALGRSVGLTELELASVFTAGVLHDVGKIAVPPSLLAKPGPLTAEERAEVERHSVTGGNMVSSISPSLAVVADAVRSHHERWDGRGYPDGLAGNAIPLFGRLVGIADVFDAVTCERAYRAAPMSNEAALDLLQRGAGRAFDPDLVAMFERLYADGALALQALPR